MCPTVVVIGAGFVVAAVEGVAIAAPLVLVELVVVVVAAILVVVVLIVVAAAAVVVVAVVVVVVVVAVALVSLSPLYSSSYISHLFYGQRTPQHRHERRQFFCHLVTLEPRATS